MRGTARIAHHEARNGDRSGHEQKRSKGTRHVEPKNDEPAYPYEELHIREGAYREVIITRISNPNSFYVRIVEFEKEFKEMKEMMSKEAHNSDCRLFRGKAVSVNVGHRNRSTWVRGLLHDPQHLRVELIDSGMSRSFSRGSVCQLDSKYLQLPKLAIKCCLTEGEPFTNATLTRFREDFIECRFLVHFKKKLAPNSFLIVLLHYEQLISFDMLKIFVDKPVTEVLSRNVVFNEKLAAKLLSWPQSSDENAFYIKLVDEESNGGKLSNEINEYYPKLKSTSKLSVNVPKSGAIYVCQDNNRWMRARFEPSDSSSPDFFHFFLIDEGRHVEVKRENVMQLLDCYSSPAQAIRCAFDGNTGWPPQLQKVLYTRFNIEFVGQNDDLLVVEYSDKSNDHLSLRQSVEVMAVNSSQHSLPFVLSPRDLMASVRSDEMNKSSEILLPQSEPQSLSLLETGTQLDTKSSTSTIKYSVSQELAPPELSTSLDMLASLGPDEMSKSSEILLPQPESQSASLVETGAQLDMKSSTSINEDSVSQESVPPELSRSVDMLAPLGTDEMSKISEILLPQSEPQSLSLLETGTQLDTKSSTSTIKDSVSQESAPPELSRSVDMLAPLGTDEMSKISEILLPEPQSVSLVESGAQLDMKSSTSTSEDSVSQESAPPELSRSVDITEPSASMKSEVPNKLATVGVDESSKSTEISLPQSEPESVSLVVDGAKLDMKCTTSIVKDSASQESAPLELSTSVDITEPCASMKPEVPNILERSKKSSDVENDGEPIIRFATSMCDEIMQVVKAMQP